MKRRSIIKLVLMVLAFGMMGANQAKAQIFITEEEEYANLRCHDENLPDGFIIPDFPNHNETWDVFTPLGNGIWLLGGLAGAYLLGKRRKKDDE